MMYCGKPRLEQFSWRQISNEYQSSKSNFTMESEPQKLPHLTAERFLPALGRTWLSMGGGSTCTGLGCLWEAVARELPQLLGYLPLRFFSDLLSSILWDSQVDFRCAYCGRFFSSGSNYCLELRYVINVLLTPFSLCLYKLHLIRIKKINALNLSSSLVIHS